MSSKKSTKKYLNLSYTLIRRDVKHPRIEVRPGIIKVIVPKDFKKVDELIENYREWIEDKAKRLKQLEEEAKNLVLYNREDLKEVIDNYINEYEKLLGIKPEKVSFRKMKLRWGSCIYKKRWIIFNKDLRFLPEELLRYVVLHEMCHLLVPNHGKKFWNLIEKFDRHYKEKERLLTVYKLRLDKLNSSKPQVY